MHRNRAKKLSLHVQRAKDKAPLINATFLQTLGIKPGILMGLLIKEGERIAILHDLSEADDVLSFLKKGHLWPEEI